MQWVQRRRRIRPIKSHMASAMYSATEKCPGKIGRNFMRMSAKAAKAPNAATIRSFVGLGQDPGLFEAVSAGERESTRNKEIHDANQPKAAEPDPTSVTGTRMESPRNNAMSVPAPIASTALAG